MTTYNWSSLYGRSFHYKWNVHKQNGFTFKNYNNGKLNPQFKTNYKMIHIFWDMALCCCVSVSGVLKERSTFIFKGQKFKNLVPDIPLKCQEPLTQWHNVTSQKTWILSYTAARTSNLLFQHVNRCYPGDSAMILQKFCSKPFK